MGWGELYQSKVHFHTYTSEEVYLELSESDASKFDGQIITNKRRMIKAENIVVV